MSNQEQALQATRALSYINQGEEDIIPEEKLGEMVTFPLGFQPFGITREDINKWRPPDEGEKVLIVNYYAPAVCVLTIFPKKGLCIKSEWIRGANHGTRSVRFFPDTPPGDNNRGICAFLDYIGNLYTVRNASRDLFLHTPPEGENKRWTLSKKNNVPPRSDGEVLWIKSIAFLSYSVIGFPCFCIFTIESNEVDNARLRSYHLDDSGLEPSELDFELPVGVYGIGMHAGKFWFITDFRSKAKHGIYSWREGDAALELVIPDICGNGIVFLSNGSALITEYGESRPGPFGGGQPGSLTYIPASMFEV